MKPRCEVWRGVAVQSLLRLRGQASTTIWHTSWCMCSQMWERMARRASTCYA